MKYPYYFFGVFLSFFFRFPVLNLAKKILSVRDRVKIFTVHNAGQDGLGCRGSKKRRKDPMHQPSCSCSRAKSSCNKSNDDIRTINIK